jgi:hypothetical protein
MCIAMAASYYRIARHGNPNGLAWYFGILDGNVVDELSSQYSHLSWSLSLYLPLPSFHQLAFFATEPCPACRDDPDWHG